MACWDRLIGITFLLKSEKVLKKGKKNQFPSSKEVVADPRSRMKVT